MRGVRTVLAATAVVALVSGSVSAAEGDAAPTTTVTSVVTPVAEGLQVTGDVTFATYSLQVAEDAKGDATETVPGELGTDIISGTVTSDPAKPRDLTFALQLDTLPAGGIGEAVIYGWDLLVDGVPTNGGTSSNLEWKRTNVSGGSASTNPYIRMRSCAPNPTTGNNTCTAGNQLPGAMDSATAVLTATTRLRDLGAVGGSAIGSNLIAVYHGTGALWFPNISSDSAFVDYEFVVPAREESVKLALVPTGAPAPKTFPVSATPSGTAATGSYSTVVPTAGLAPGSYDLITRACWGGNCGETRTPVTL